jgi:beta-lactamase class A
VTLQTLRNAQIVQQGHPVFASNRSLAARVLAFALFVVLTAACSQGDSGKTDPEAQAAAEESRARVQESVRAAETPAEKALQAELRRLGEGFDGEIGLAVQDIESGWTAHFNGNDHFPQQSVSKIWVAIAAMATQIFHQPLRPLALRPGGYTTTLEGLLDRAITRSDNTANDYLLRQVGGPEAVRETLEDMGIAGVRFGPGERAMQSAIAGMEWRPEYSLGRSFYEARDQVPHAVRRAAFEAYVADPIDGATPIGIVDALARLQKGELLSPASTERLIGIMEQARSGSQRLKGGLPAGWSIAHKTGTGQEFEGMQAGYNDVGILTSPSGRAYGVAVLMGRASQPQPERRSLMHELVGAVADYERDAPPSEAR